MDRIITNELIMYKAGFMQGKDVMLNIIEESEDDKILRESIGNKNINELMNNEDSIFYKEDLGDPSWFTYGYDDAYTYYLKQYIENGFIKTDEYLKNGSDRIMQDLFTKRVIKMNEENGTMIASTKFKM